MSRSVRILLAISAFADSSPLTRASSPTARSYRASADALSAKRESPEYATIRDQSPRDGPNESRREARRFSVTRSAGMWPVAPWARRMPSITAQSMPALFAARFRFDANFGDRRTVGGVGSGSGEFSQIVAALAGPSISGFGAGFVFGSSTLRSCTHCDWGSLRPLERWPVWPFELDEPVLGAVEDEACPEDDALLTCVKPP